jgi:hypothetical protein
LIIATLFVNCPGDLAAGYYYPEIATASIDVSVAPSMRVLIPHATTALRSALLKLLSIFPREGQLDEGRKQTPRIVHAIPPHPEGCDQGERQCRHGFNRNTSAIKAIPDPANQERRRKPAKQSIRPVEDICAASTAAVPDARLYTRHDMAPLPFAYQASTT